MSGSAGARAARHSRRRSPRASWPTRAISRRRREAARRAAGEIAGIERRLDAPAQRRRPVGRPAVGGSARRRLASTRFGRRRRSTPVSARRAAERPRRTPSRTRSARASASAPPGRRPPAEPGDERLDNCRGDRATPRAPGRAGPRRRRRPGGPRARGPRPADRGRRRPRRDGRGRPATSARPRSAASSLGRPLERGPKAASASSGRPSRASSRRAPTYGSGRPARARGLAIRPTAVSSRPRERGRRGRAERVLVALVQRVAHRARRRPLRASRRATPSGRAAGSPTGPRSRLRGPSITADVISSPRWAGRQCMATASGPAASSSASSTR